MMQYAGMHFISFHIWEQTREADPVFRFLGLPWNYDPLLLRLQTKKRAASKVKPLMILMAGGFQHELRQGNLTGKWSEPLALADSRFQRVDLQPVRSASDCVGTLVAAYHFHTQGVWWHRPPLQVRRKPCSRSLPALSATQCNTLAS